MKNYYYMKIELKITSYILENFNTKTHRNEYYNIKEKRLNGFNAMFVVQSVEAKKLYYQEFKTTRKIYQKVKRLKVATIYSFAPNEEQMQLVKYLMKISK